MGDEYGHTVGDGDGAIIVTMASRHDAIGLKALLDRVSDRTHPVEPVEKTWEGELATLAPMEADA